MPKPTTVGTWLEWAKTKIDPADAELIAVRSFAPEDTDRSWLVTHQDYPLPDDLEHHFVPANQMVEERAQGKPLAYLLNQRNFYGRDFYITDHVLIPRPESEAIIDLVKTLDLPAQPHIIDLGTGSGCLAITLALEIPQATIVGTDISRDALQTAEVNNNYLEGRVTLVASDLLSNIHPEEHGAFDVIVGNLPYVNPAWEWLDFKTLVYEPQLALYPERGTSENGLSAYHRLFDELAEYTKTAPVHNLILEADPCQHEELINLAKSYHWQHHATNGYVLAFQPTNR